MFDGLIPYARFVEVVIELAKNVAQAMLDVIPVEAQIAHYVNNDYSGIEHIYTVEDMTENVMGQLKNYYNGLTVFKRDELPLYDFIASQNYMMINQDGIRLSEDYVKNVLPVIVNQVVMGTLVHEFMLKSLQAGYF